MKSTQIATIAAVIMAILVSLALVASYLTSRLIVENREEVSVVVAKRKMPSWHMIESPEDVFAEKWVLKAAVPNNYVPFDKVRELKNRSIIGMMEADTILTYDNLQDETKASIDIGMTAGKRAIGIEVIRKYAGSGHFLPGTHVDVIHITKDGNEEKTKVILRDVVIRAVDSVPMVDSVPKHAKYETVTLEVIPRDAEILASAMTTGTLTLSLHAEDEKPWTCTIEYRGKTHKLSEEESRRAKAMFEEREKKAPGGTTDEKESVFQAPQSVFVFTKEDVKPIRYLVFHEDEPFTIEVATGDDKTRRSFFGDEGLRTKVKEIINKAFPKK